MDDTNDNRCSFCLKTVYDNEFDVVGECIRQMLDGFLIPNLEISNKTLICNECATTLRDVVVFKTAFIRSEENAKLALKEEPDMIALNDDSLEQKMCRFCKAMVHCESHTNLREKEYVDMVDMIQKHIPEFKFSDTEKLRTCGNCLDLLQSFSNFVMNCSSSEVKIKEEIDEIDTKDDLKLNDQQNYIFKNEVDCNDIKTEKIEQNAEDMSTYEIMYKNFMGDSLELHSKNEDTEYKADQKVAERYLDTEKAELSHQCHLCPFSNNDKSKLSHHLINHMTIEECTKNESAFVCDKCGFQTTLRRNLSEHMERHKSKEDKTADSSHKEFKCDKCSFETFKRKYLHQHKFTHLEPDNAKIVECYICGYKTKRKRALVRHVQVHMLRPYEPMPDKCHFCPYQPKSLSRLRRHLFTHKTFAECAQLGITIKCDKCDFLAKHKERLYDHMKTHEPKKEKPCHQYSCDQCSYVTQTKRLLKSHLNRHMNDDNPDLALYACDKCDFKSKWRSSRNKHMKRFHKIAKGDVEDLPNGAGECTT